MMLITVMDQLMFMVKLMVKFKVLLSAVGVAHGEAHCVAMGLLVEHNNGCAHADANGVAPSSDTNVDTNHAAHGNGHVEA